MKTLTIVKIGGNVIDDQKSLNKFLSDFSKLKGAKILVHGGGKLATQLSQHLGIKTKMIDGRRITDSETLKITTMVYAGWINKSITAQLNSKKTKAIGLCGADVTLIPATKRKTKNIDYGFVGDIIENNIHTVFISSLINQNIVPVIAPITSGYNGQLYNTNADTVTSGLATALSKSYKVKIIYCFEKNGVLNGKKVISKLNALLYAELKQNKIIINGMIPKLDNAFKALEKGVQSVVIGNSKQLQKLNQNGGSNISIK